MVGGTDSGCLLKAMELLNNSNRALDCEEGNNGHVLRIRYGWPTGDYGLLLLAWSTALPGTCGQTGRACVKCGCVCMRSRR